jgi:hypothetical protein
MKNIDGHLGFTGVSLFVDLITKMLRQVGVYIAAVRLQASVSSFAQQ